MKFAKVFSPQTPGFQFILLLLGVLKYGPAKAGFITAPTTTLGLFTSHASQAFNFSGFLWVNPTLIPHSHQHKEPERVYNFSNFKLGFSNLTLMEHSKPGMLLKKSKVQFEKSKVYNHSKSLS
ncbi:MAG: hypothetical protein KDD14_04835 [Saprospiraceae bacterium]|nr:hypothetical protein [Saprospiraceae bacterium]